MANTLMSQIFCQTPDLPICRPADLPTCRTAEIAEGRTSGEAIFLKRRIESSGAKAPPTAWVEFMEFREQANQ